MHCLDTDWTSAFAAAMPKTAKSATQRHSRASIPAHDDDSDSGPEQEFHRTKPARSQPRPGRMTNGRAAHPQHRAETPEQRMLRRMEAGPSDDDDDDASGGLLQGSPGSSNDGGGSEAPSDDGAAVPSDMDDSDGSGGNSHSRDGDSGAGPSFESDVVSFNTSALYTVLFRHRSATDVEAW